MHFGAGTLSGLQLGAPGIRGRGCGLQERGDGSLRGENLLQSLGKCRVLCLPFLCFFSEATCLLCARLDGLKDGVFVACFRRRQLRAVRRCKCLLEKGRTLAKGGADGGDFGERNRPWAIVGWQILHECLDSLEQERECILLGSECLALLRALSSEDVPRSERFDLLCDIGALLECEGDAIAVFGQGLGLGLQLVESSSEDSELLGRAGR